MAGVPPRHPLLGSGLLEAGDGVLAAPCLPLLPAVGATVQLDAGWFEFESDIWSQMGNEYAHINAGETYTVTGSFSLGGTQNVTQSSQLYVHYYDGSTLLGDPVLLLDSSEVTDTLDFVATLLPPPDADSLKFASIAHVLNGSVSYDIDELSYRVPGNSVQRSTYYLAGKAIATRINGDGSNDGLYFFHSDHLGSASVMSYGQGHASVGQKVAGSETRYLPFGDWRTEPTANLTELGYTGHHQNNFQGNDLGLIYMNARFYVGGIGRFASADTIVPDPVNPQAYNRYSYVNNNPSRYIDPSGHCGGEVSQEGDPLQGTYHSVFSADYTTCNNIRMGLENTYGIEIDWAGWTLSEMEVLESSINAVNSALGTVGIAWEDTPLNNIKFVRDDSDKVEWRNPLTGVIHITNNVFSKPRLEQRHRVWHEMAHAIDSGFGNDLHDLYDDYSGNCPGIICNVNEAADGYYYRDYGYEARGWAYDAIFSRQGETWSDAFAAWVYNRSTWDHNVNPTGSHLPNSFVSGRAANPALSSGPNWQGIYNAVENSLTVKFE